MFELQQSLKKVTPICALWLAAANAAALPALDIKKFGTYGLFPVFLLPTEPYTALTFDLSISLRIVRYKAETLFFQLFPYF